MSLNPFPVRLGRLWFRWRSFSPVPFVLLMLVLPPNFVLSAWGMAGVSLVIIAAEALRIWGVGYAGSSTRTRADTVGQLVHAGPYRRTRNPLYVGNILLYTGCGVFLGFSWLSAALFLFTCAEYHFIVKFEESILKKTFGKSYENYCAHVPRWGFATTPYPSSAHEFSLTRALRSERSSFIALASFMVLASIKSLLQVL